jgi:hypothetical protein
MRQAAIFLALLLPGMAQAHVLDEYVQHSVIAIGKDRITVNMRLQPGALVAGKVLGTIEHDGKPGLSRAEIEAYGRRVLGDLAVTLDGRQVSPGLLSAEASNAKELRQGTGDIRIVYVLPVPPAPGRHRLTLENRHQKRFSAYVVNSLTPEDPAISGIVQSRNPDQSRYQLDYTTAR